MATAWIENPADAELVSAWERLRAKVGVLEGWQYMGSQQQAGKWQHCFRNRYALESAQSEKAYEAARQVINASSTWQPSA